MDLCLGIGRGGEWEYTINDKLCLNLHFLSMARQRQNLHGHTLALTPKNPYFTSADASPEADLNRGLTALNPLYS